MTLHTVPFSFFFFFLFLTLAISSHTRGLIKVDLFVLLAIKFHFRCLNFVSVFRPSFHVSVCWMNTMEAFATATLCLTVSSNTTLQLYREKLSKENHLKNFKLHRYGYFKFTFHRYKNTLEKCLSQSRGWYVYEPRVRDTASLMV